MTCPLCSSNSSIELWKDKKREYFQCDTCSLIYVPLECLPSIDEERERYDHHENDPEDEGYRSFLMKLVSPLDELLVPGSEGLDFGAGPTPALAGLIKGHGYRIERYDPYFANDKALLERNYDFITATEVVEHFHSPGYEFERLFDMLKPDGLLGIMTMLAPERDDFKNWWYKNDLTHVCFYSEETVLWISARWNVHIEFMKGNVILFRK